MMMSCFCKQKTVYELRISDWSSDVSSSDLRAAINKLQMHDTTDLLSSDCSTYPSTKAVVKHSLHEFAFKIPVPALHFPRTEWQRNSCPERSEEHTSELQSLMRISYAVLCLNKNRTRPASTRRQPAVR